MALQLHIEAVAEDRLQCVEARAGEIGVAGGQRQIDHPVRAAGERDQTLRVLAKRGDRGNHLSRLRGGEIGGGRQSHEVGVAAFVLGEERDAAIGAWRPSLGARQALPGGGGAQ